MATEDHTIKGSPPADTMEMPPVVRKWLKKNKIRPFQSNSEDGSKPTISSSAPMPEDEADAFPMRIPMFRSASYDSFISAARIQAPPNLHSQSASSHPGGRGLMTVWSWLAYWSTLLWEFLQRVSGYFGSSSHRRALLVQNLESSESYQEWYSHAQELDWLDGNDAWKNTPQSSLYDWQLIEARLLELRSLSSVHNTRGLVAALRAGLLRNLGGLGNRELHLGSLTGTKRLIEDYIEEVCTQLRMIADSPEIPLADRFDIFWDTRQAFGRSALLLSGGAALGMYHLGVIRALWERKLLPRIMSGSSAGAIVCAIVGVLRESEMHILWEEGSLRLDAFGTRSGGWPAFKRRVNRLLTEGVLMDVSLLEEVIRENVGDFTFKEAYERTGRIINITVASTSLHEASRLLNHLTAPNVLIYSAASASCALKYLYTPVELMAKDYNGNIVPYHPSGLKWSDGSVPDDLPMKRLSELFDVNHFIVSQVNPHVVPFIPKTDAKPGLFTALLRSELAHRIHQVSMFLPFGELSMIVKQIYKGNITIVPSLGLRDFLGVVSSPTPDSLRHAILLGQRSTWPHVSYVRNHFQIEKVLEECTQRLRTQLFPHQFSRRLAWGSH